MADLTRFYMKNGSAFDAGDPISEAELRDYLGRQWKAMEQNKRMGPLGEKANALMVPEYNQAHDIYKALRPDLYKTPKK